MSTSRLLALAGLSACAALGCGSSPAPTTAPATPPPTPSPEAPPAAVTAPAAAAPAATYQGHGAESVTAETIARFAAPPLDRAVSTRIQSMLDVRGAGTGLLTSRGDRMFFHWKVTGVEQVWRQDGPMAFPVQLTGGEDATQVVAITPDDKTLIVQRDRGGEENPGLYLLSVEGGPLRAIQHAPKVQTFFQFVSDDGRWVYFRANDIAPTSYAIYRTEIATGTKEKVFAEPGIWSVLDHRGQRLLLRKELGSTHEELHELDLATGRRTALLGEGESEEYDAVYGARDGALVVMTNKPGAFRSLYEWKPGAALRAILPAADRDVESIDTDQARTRILYKVNDGGRVRLAAIDARTYKPVRVEIPGAEVVELGGTTRDGRLTVVGYESPTQPQIAAVWSWKAQKLTRWRLPSAPEVDLASFAPATVETYPARDGTPIPMLVRRPARCAKEVCPVVVDFHGGPEGQSQPRFSATGQLFVDAGFVYVLPNVRGSTGYGKAWFHADDGPRRLDVITDIEDCARHIRSAWARDGVAPRVGVMGGSYGGYSTLMAMTYFAGAYDVGVSNVGISNLVTFLANTAPYRRILRTSEYGDPDKDRDALVKLSPSTYLDRVKAPLLVIQGVNDPRVPVGEALQIHAALEAKKVPTGLVLFPDEGHGAKKRGNIVLQLGHTLAFFEKYLKS